MQDTHHYLASLSYNWMMRILLRTQVQDNLGGFFTMKLSRLKELPLDLVFYGYGDYFFRLLHYAEKRRMSVVEIPAKYLARAKGQSKSNFLKMLFAYTGAVIRLKFESAHRDSDVRR